MSELGERLERKGGKDEGKRAKEMRKGNHE